MFRNSLLLVLLLFSSAVSQAKADSIYNYAGVIPIIVDDSDQAWVYFGVEYINNKKALALLAGGKEKEDPNSLSTALREMNEESLDVFSEYINPNSLSLAKPAEINYNVWFLISTKLYLYSTKSDWADTYCDKFINLYNERRYKGTGDYHKLKLAQRENYELRKVKVEDLIDFLHDPNKYDYHLTSYGGKECSKPDNLPLRWSSRIILRNQPSLQHYNHRIAASKGS